MTTNNRIKALARKYQDALDVPYMKALPLAQMANEVIPDRVVYSSDDQGVDDTFTYEEPLMYYPILLAMGGDWVLKHFDMEGPYRWFYSEKLDLSAEFASANRLQLHSGAGLEGLTHIKIYTQNDEVVDWKSMGLEAIDDDLAHLPLVSSDIFEVIEQVRVAFARINQ